MRPILNIGLFIFLLNPLLVQAENLLLYPFGDSITKGWSVDPDKFGYRNHLQNALTNTYDFVGAYKLPLTDLSYDVDHGGLSAKRTDEMKLRLATSLPLYMAGVDGVNSVILIHAGTNDIDLDYGTGTQSEKLDSYVANVEDMIGIVHRYNPDIQVYVALLIPINDSRDSIVQAYNSKLSAMLVANGKSNLFIVDMHTAFTKASNWQDLLMGDLLHPNDAGYAIMALEWSFVISENMVLIDGER